MADHNQSFDSSIDYDDSSFKYNKSKASLTDTKTSHTFLNKSQNVLGSFFPMNSNDWYILGFIGVIGLLVRFFKISHPHSVVFDEVHFGGFASKYVKNEYFFDVHPPLAKLMIAGVAWFFGFDGGFDFKTIGKDFVGNNVPYVAMRIAQATFGWLLIPTVYLTAKVSGLTTESASLAAIMILFENSLITQSRYIFLDPPLILFSALAVLFWLSFCNSESAPFSKKWWISLTMTGVFLGLTLSCKWVGLFTVALIGLSTVKQLWDLIGDLRITLSLYIHHFLARAFCLIAIPLTIYLACFQIQFMVLTNYTDSANTMSTEFQKTLKGNKVVDAKKDVAMGSEIRIKHVATNGGFLHSHNLFYPGGSKQQQVTLYSFPDSNNIWIIKPAHISDENSTKAEGVQFIKDKDIIRLYHTSTGKHLHSHPVRPVFSSKEYINEVSGYEYNDTNDNFRVEILKGDSRDEESKSRLMAIYTRFRLVHVGTGCVLYSRPEKLPKWASEQQQVFCIKDGFVPRSEWVIVHNQNEVLTDSPAVSFARIGFFQKFLELNKKMWTSNNGLTDSHPYDSRPHQWPTLRRGISFWGTPTTQIYLLGNPVVWYLGTFSVGAFLVIHIVTTILGKRGISPLSYATQQKYSGFVGFFVIAWLLHLVPFFLMKRQLFLHHYLPAMYFALLAFISSFDLILRQFRPRSRLGLVTFVSILTVYVYLKFSSLIYGLTWTKAECNAAKWGKFWDFDCDKPPQ